MIRWLAVVALLLACRRGSDTATTVPPEILDGKATPTAASSEPTPKPAAISPSVLAPEAACARLVTLLDAGCAWAHRFPADIRVTSTCVTSLSKWFAPETPDHDQLRRMVGCWAQDCEPAAACMVSVKLATPSTPPPPRNCGDEGTAPILVDAAAWAARPGANAKKFADVRTTVEAPIEVCGIEGELDWITRVTCDNGSNPYGSVLVANDARDGWMQRGGRCNSILDRYSVRCPEATYQIHVDRYVCPRP